MEKLEIDMHQDEARCCPDTIDCLYSTTNKMMSLYIVDMIMINLMNTAMHHPGLLSETGSAIDCVDPPFTALSSAVTRCSTIFSGDNFSSTPIFASR